MPFRLLAALFILLAATATASSVEAAQAVRSPFGTLPGGGKVETVTLTNARGMSVRLMSYGAAIQSFMAPDRDGKIADIALGYNTLGEYLAKPQYFGATVGRFANRIAKGRFTLDGHTYSLPINNGKNSLHGGTVGFDKVLWTIADVKQGPDSASVTFRYVSPDGDQGYPGALTVQATYTLSEHDELFIDYSATTDRPTIVNISNHTYWNLSGEGAGSVMDDLLAIRADAITPVDATQIPTGAIVPVAGTPFDFRSPKPIGRDIRKGAAPQLLIGQGYDMNWVVNRIEAAATRLVASVEDPKSGRILELMSAKPGLQFYSGNFLDGTTIGKSGRIYRQGDAFVLEPQLFPDTPNHPSFGTSVLLPGQKYRNLIVYRFITSK